MASVDPHTLPTAARNAVLCALMDLIGSYQDWAQKGKPDSFHDWGAHLATIDELALEFDLQSHIPKDFHHDLHTLAVQPANGLQGNNPVQRPLGSEATRLAAVTKPIATWKERLGNSDRIVASGAVGQAMQDEIDALRTALALAQGGWSPLESAPKDGTEIMAVPQCGYDRSLYQDGFWFWSNAGGDSFAAGPEPTGWKPMPVEAVEVAR